MSEPFRPPGLPPDAVPIELRSLETEMQRSKLVPATLPMSAYDAMLVVNGLAILEGAMLAQGTQLVAAEANKLQRYFVQHVPFAAAVREQMQKNRQMMQLNKL